MVHAAIESIDLKFIYIIVKFCYFLSRENKRLRGFGD